MVLNLAITRMSFRTAFLLLSKIIKVLFVLDKLHHMLKRRKQDNSDTVTVGMAMSSEKQMYVDKLYGRLTSPKPDWLRTHHKQPWPRTAQSSLQIVLLNGEVCWLEAESWRTCQLPCQVLTHRELLFRASKRKIFPSIGVVVLCNVLTTQNL